MYLHATALVAGFSFTLGEDDDSVEDDADDDGDDDDDDSDSQVSTGGDTVPGHGALLGHAQPRRAGTLFGSPQPRRGCQHAADDRDPPPRQGRGGVQHLRRRRGRRAAEAVRLRHASESPRRRRRGVHRGVPRRGGVCEVRVGHARGRRLRVGLLRRGRRGRRLRGSLRRSDAADQRQR